MRAKQTAPAWAVLAAVAAVVQAQAPDSQDSGPQHLDRFIEETRTLRAEFSQELLNNAGQLIETASGTFSLKRPDRFYWSYDEPFEQQVVADTANLWIYDAELEQATVTPLEGAISSSPAMLLSGDREALDGFEIVEGIRDGPIDWVRLVPKEQGTDFNSVRVGFDSGTLFALELVDALGQITLIQFQDVLVNPDIEDEFFQFEPPAGADVIGEPAGAPR